MIKYIDKTGNGNTESFHLIDGGFFSGNIKFR